MLNEITETAQRLYCQTTRPFRRWSAGIRLRSALGRLSEDELDRAMADAGMSRSDLVTIFKGGAGNRQLMARMMKHFRVDPQNAALRYWGALRDAERVCTHCVSTKRCRRWLDWGASNDAPRIFCPNAQLFDHMARSSRAEDGGRQ